MKHFLIAGSILSLAALSISPAYGDGDATRGETYFAVCAACHGADGAGNQELHAPNLTGQYDWYLARQLRNTIAGIRGTDPRDEYGAQMRSMALSLNGDQAVDDVVAYILTLDHVPAATTGGGDAARGQAAYVVCGACHGVAGEGNVALNSPRLAGQHDWYIMGQLQAYKEGIRGTHPEDAFGTQMRPMAMTLVTDQSIADVAAYISSMD